MGAAGDETLLGICFNETNEVAAVAINNILNKKRKTEYGLR
jgi:hypothetical protein